MISTPWIYALIIILFSLYAIASIQDIKYRQTYRLRIPLIVLSIAGLVSNLIHSFDNIWSILTAVVIFVAIHILNVAIKKRIVGGADLDFYLASCCVLPTVLELWTAIWLPLVSFIFAAATHIIPFVSNLYQKRNVPFIPFMGVGMLCGTMFTVLI